MARGARVSIRRLAAALLIVLAAPCFARAELIGAKLDKVEAAPEPEAQAAPEPAAETPEEPPAETPAGEEPQ